MLTLVSGACASFAGAVLLYAAVGKVRHLAEFKRILHEIFSTTLTTDRRRLVAAQCLVGSEAALGILLLSSSGRLLRLSAAMASMLASGFIPVVMTARRQRRPCGCMGGRSAPVTGRRIGWNILLVLSACTAALWPDRSLPFTLGESLTAALSVSVGVALFLRRSTPQRSTAPATARKTQWSAPHTRRSFLRHLVGLVGAATGLGLVSNVARPLRAYACDYWNYSVATPNPAEVGQSVTFRAPYTSTSPGSQVPVTVQWGDGGIDTYILDTSLTGEFVQTHVYGRPGTFEIIADFQDVAGSTTTTVVTVNGTGQPDDCEMAHATCDACSDEFTRQCVADAEAAYHLCLLNASTPQDVEDCQNQFNQTHTACIETGAATSNCCVDCLEACDMRADQCAQGACTTCWPIPPI